MTEDYRARMLDLMSKALANEEAWLHVELLERRKHLPSLKSVRQFEERWIQYLTVKQSLCDRESLTVETETEGRCDFVLRDYALGRILAVFEMKGPFHVGAGEPIDVRFADIAKDCRKLAENEKLGRVPRCVVLLPYGHKEEVNEWLDKLRGYLQDVDGSGYTVSPLRLNDLGDRGTTMMITVFEVSPHGNKAF